MIQFNLKHKISNKRGMIIHDNSGYWLRFIYATFGYSKSTFIGKTQRSVRRFLERGEWEINHDKNHMDIARRDSE